MKKSKLAIGVVVALGVVWAGGAWFTGQKAETEYKRQIEYANQQFKALGISNTFNIEYKNKSFERNWFSSQVEDELIVAIPRESKEWKIPFSTKLYHGPLPLNHLAKFNLIPALFSAEGFIGKNESTQLLFDLTKSEKPLQYQASTSYGLSTKGSLTFAKGEATNSKFTAQWSDVELNFDANKDFKGAYSLETNEYRLNSSEDPSTFSWKGLKYEITFEPTKWQYLYTGKGTSTTEQFEMTVVDNAGNPMSYAEKGTKSTTEISVNGDVIDFKGKNIVDEMQLDGKSLGKLTYNNELGHIDANALNALIESFIEVVKASNHENADLMTKIIMQDWIKTHGMAILNNQPQIKINPISLSDEKGKLELDVNIALAKNPTFDLMRGNFYKQFTDFAIDVQLNKATVENIIDKLVPETEKANAKAKIAASFAEAEQNGIAVNGEKSVTIKLVLKNGELKLNGTAIPEQQVQNAIFMLLMSGALPH